MKVRCAGLDLSDAVNKVIKAASVKGVSSVLEGIKLTADNGVLTLAATDLELAIEKKIKADCLIEGEAVVPGRLFSEYIRRLINEEVELHLNEKNQLKIKYSDSEGFLQCYNSLEFPNLKKIDNAEYFSIKYKDFKTLINKSIISVALDDSRPILKGCLFEVEDAVVSAVALDGYRLALVTKPITKATARLSVVVPSRSLAEISKLLDESDDLLQVYIQKNYLMVDLKDTLIMTRLLDGDFINYRKIIPTKQSSTVTVSRAQLETALDRAALLSRTDRNNIVRFDIKEKHIIITGTSDAGSITEKITINLSGSEVKIAFNAKYLVDVLKSQNDEFVKITFESAIDPCLIRPDMGNEFLYLILPVRMA